MVFFNYSTMQMAAKVVYYGPGLGGKTTNLHWIYSKTATASRGEMVSLETETDRTLFFDLLPIDVGQIAGFTTRIQLYTVPGQVFYNTTRKLVLKGVDGVVFVADSQRAMRQANADSFKNLEENLEEMGLSVYSIPLALQYNKRDLPDICTVDELNAELNGCDWPFYEAVAIDGKGVFETLKGVSKLTLLSLKQRLLRGSEAGAPAAAAGPPGAAAAARAAAARAGAAAKEAPTVERRATPRPGSPGVAAPPPATAAPPPAAAAKPTARPAPPRPPAAAPPPRTAAPAAAAADTVDRRRITRRTVDVENELALLRREALSPGQPGGARAGSNGRGELSRSIALTLKREDFTRARRVNVSLTVEDADNRVVDTVRGLRVELDPHSGGPEALRQVLLNLRIALQARE
jgi:hypothetical protein